MDQSTLPLTYAIGFRTDVGLQRTLNEDAAAVFDLPGTAAAFVVCDGMGGLQAGDAASKEAVRVVQTVLTEQWASGPPADVEAALRDAFTRANDAVNGLHTPASRAAAVSAIEAEDAPTVRRGSAVTAALMGTTCVAGVVIGDELTLAHAGDSRAYLWRGGRLSALTEDHSYVGERVRAGDITEAEARVSKFRNMITRAIGIDAVVDPEVRRETLVHGDTVLVCSDGLTTMLEDPEIAQMFRAPAQQRATPEKAASAFVDAANKKGGHDNTTVLILRVRREGSDAPSVSNSVETISAAPAERRGNGSSGSISPTVVVVLCALLALAAIAAGVFFMQMKQERAQNHNTGSPPAGTLTLPGAVDYTRLVYDSPQLYTGFLARGDILTYSREGGLYMVGGSTGALVALDRSGKPGRTIANFEAVGAQAAIPSTRLFVVTDPQGNTYITYTKNRVLEKRAPDGRLLQTLRGFERPEAVAVNDNGDLFVIDFNQVKVLRAHLPQATPPLSSPQAAAAPRPAASVKPAPATAGKK